jgi:hypothetical protein
MVYQINYQISSSIFRLVSVTKRLAQKLIKITEAEVFVAGVSTARSAAGCDVIDALSLSSSLIAPGESNYDSVAFSMNKKGISDALLTLLQTMGVMLR